MLVSNGCLPAIEQDSLLGYLYVTLNWRYSFRCILNFLLEPL